MDFSSETKGFLPKVYEIFWSEMPLGGSHRHSKPGLPLFVTYAFP